jgi:hypothetical protein
MWSLALPSGGSGVVFPDLSSPETPDAQELVETDADTDVART